MADAYVADVQIEPPHPLGRKERLALSVPEIDKRLRNFLADLPHVVPYVLKLQYGTLKAHAFTEDGAFGARLLLAPQRTLFSSPTKAKEPLLDEVQLLRDGLKSAGLRLLRGRREARKRIENEEEMPSIDPLLLVLRKRSRTRWLANWSDGQHELQFPECDSVIVETAVRLASGTVYCIKEHAIVLRDVRAEADAALTVQERFLPLVGGEPQVKCGQRIEVQARVVRDVILGSVVGLERVN